MQRAARSEERTELRLQFNPLGASVRVILIWKADGLHTYYTDHQNQNPNCLWTTKVSFSCRHPTHLSTPCEVTFLTYLPRHMTGEHESSNQEDRTRGSMNTPWVKGPLSLLLKATIRQTTDGKRCRDNAYKDEHISKAHGAVKSLCTVALLLTKSNSGWRETLSCDQTNAARGRDT